MLRVRSVREGNRCEYKKRCAGIGYKRQRRMLVKLKVKN